MPFRSPPSRLLLLAPLLAACFVDRAPHIGSAAGSDTGTGSASGSETSTGAVGVTTSGDPTASATDTSATGTGPAASSGEGSMGDPTDSECADMAGLPQDSACTDASGCGCASGTCNVVPILGGWCGECTNDGECDPGGCTPPNPVKRIGSQCNMGEPGAGCQSDDVCVDPAHSLCAVILAVEGIISVSTCGECKVNANCPAIAPNCSPVYAVEKFSGAFACVADGSVANGGGCNLSPTDTGPIGDLACASGKCGEATVMGLLAVGICGECNSDADCQVGLTCVDPAVDLDAGTLSGAVCK